MPAQVPNVGMPSASRAAIGSNSPAVCSSRDIVVLSPPGMTSESTAARSIGCADLASVGAEVLQDALVRAERSLQREHPDRGHLGLCRPSVTSLARRSAG